MWSVLGLALCRIEPAQMARIGHPGDAGRRTQAALGAQVGKVQGLDQPTTVDLLVGFEVVTPAVVLCAVGPDVVVLKHPNSGRGALRSQLDFRHMAMVDALHHLQAPRIGHHGFAPANDLAACPGRVDHDILGKDTPVKLPILGIESTEIAGLELLDFFQVVHGHSLSKSAISEIFAYDQIFAYHQIFAYQMSASISGLKPSRISPRLTLAVHCGSPIKARPTPTRSNSPAMKRSSNGWSGA